jgi:hypothetical protein
MQDEQVQALIAEFQRFQAYGLEPPRMGLSHDEIESLPVHVVTTQDEVITCSICLVDLKPNDECREIGTCSHRFHKECIDEWLILKNTCPNCRTHVPSESSALLPEMI